MKEFEKIGKVPNIITDRGEPEEDVIKTDITSYDFNLKGKTLNKQSLFQILFNVFQHKEVIMVPSNPSVKKIIPSGGGKHPIEAHIQLNKDFDGIEKGFYTYDINNNCLIRNKKEYVTTSSSDIVIVFAFRPEKPSWRYREIRSFRAVYIDAGHVLKMFLEMLSWVEDEMIVNINRINFLQFYNDDSDWLDEPQLVEISFGKNSSHSIKEYKSEDYSYEEVKTNPFGNCYIREGKLYFQGDYPQKFNVEISKHEFMVLNHCIPSRRRDRISTYEFLKENFGSDLINKLIDCGALIDIKLANNLYDKIFQWSQKNWYINLLEHVNNVATENIIIAENIHTKSKMINLNNLLERKTVRKFTENSLSKEQLLRIVEDVNLEELPVETFINVRNVDEYPSGIYSVKNNTLTRVGDKIAISKVRKCVTNQPFSAQGAIDIFFKTSVNNEKFMTGMISMGILCQGVLNAATDLGLGCFTTPAISDSLANELFSGDIYSSYYYICIGYERGKYDNK